jgi:hypothetical protein
MHGFLDVILGSAFGAGLGLLEFHYGPALDLYMHSSTWLAPLTCALIIIALVRVHPEPADDCPCFDDSVAFAGVVIGLEIGTWTYGKTPWDPWDGYAHGTHSIKITSLGLPVLVARAVFGVAVVLAWREAMKPALLKGLPHLFRLIESVGLNLPRRFFKPASEYKSIPANPEIDSLFPKMSYIPRAMESIRHPKTRGRSVSIGPQSAADAYETLAYRERRRRESIGSNSSVKSRTSQPDSKDPDEDVSRNCASASGAHQGMLKEYESMMGRGEVTVSTPEGGDADRQAGGLPEKEMFSRLVKPRVRYDVEVVTKLVVYTGKSAMPKGCDLGSELVRLTSTLRRYMFTCRGADSHYVRVCGAGSNTSPD